MSRPLPPDVAAQLRPIPDDFSPTFEDMPGYVRWRATLPIEGLPDVQVELGFSLACGQAGVPMERANLRAAAWQATELARLGRRDLLDYCLVGRHKR